VRSRGLTLRHVRELAIKAVERAPADPGSVNVDVGSDRQLAIMVATGAGRYGRRGVTKSSRQR
jgi:hypothetical protein